MGDAENGLPLSKKRAAGRELNRDNPGLDDEEDTEQEAGTFKRASDEVLATRKIVKVRRNQSSAPSSNPFAGIKLMPTTSATQPKVTTDVQDTDQKTVSEDVVGNSNSNKNSEAEAEPKANVEAEVEPKANVEAEAEPKANVEAEVEPKANVEAEAEPKVNVEAEAEPKDNVEAEAEPQAEVGSEVEAKTEPEDNKQSVSKTTDTDAEQAVDDNSMKSDAASEATKPVTDAEQAAGEDQTENSDRKDNKTENTSFSLFHHLSSSQNAFTNLSGTGFSTSTFSFGSIAKDGSTLGSNSGFGLGLSNNGNSSLFGGSGSGTSVASKTEGSSFPSMQEVLVETGEEDEKSVFTAESALFEFIDGGWKERGKGEVKVNVSTTKERARLVMRARGNYRLILNASLYPDMKLTNMDKKGISFACMNIISEGTNDFSTFALKFKDVSMVEEFRSAVTAHKGNKSAAVITPENSPKASDDAEIFHAGSN